MFSVLRTTTVTFSLKIFTRRFYIQSKILFMYHYAADIFFRTFFYQNYCRIKNEWLNFAIFKKLKH